MASLFALFSGNKWLYYVVLILAVGLGGISYLYKKQVENNGYLSAQLNKLEIDLASSQKDLALKESSCKADDISVVENTQEQQTLTNASNQIDKKLEELKHKASLKSNTNVIPKGDNVNVKNTVVPDDGILSDNLYRLLKSSYCTAEPESSLCVSPK